MLKKLVRDALSREPSIKVTSFYIDNEPAKILNLAIEGDDITLIALVRILGKRLKRGTVRVQYAKSQKERAEELWKVVVAKYCVPTESESTDDELYALGEEVDPF